MFAAAQWVQLLMGSKAETDSAQIKYLRVPDEIIEVVKEQQVKDQAQRGGRGGMHSRGDHRGDRGGRGTRGRGRGRGRGGGGNNNNA
jgi:U6 snRNA-associated Sm-like protein LSm4